MDSSRETLTREYLRAKSYAVVHRRHFNKNTYKCRQMVGYNASHAFAVDEDTGVTMINAGQSRVFRSSSCRHWRASRGIRERFHHGLDQDHDRHDHNKRNNEAHRPNSCASCCTRGSTPIARVKGSVEAGLPKKASDRNSQVKHELIACVRSRGNVDNRGVDDKICTFCSSGTWTL